MKLKDKVAIITGAGGGIGRAIAEAYAKEGARLVLAGRTERHLHEVADKVRSYGAEPLSLVTDVSRSEDTEALLTMTISRLGTIDILVNNAGMIGPIGQAFENDINHWINTIHVNLIGTFLTTRAVLPIMMKKKSGKVINLAGGGDQAYPRFSAYAASKAAVARFTESIAAEVKGYGIDVNCIAPGAVNTGILNEILAAGSRAGDQEFAKRRRQKQEGGVDTALPARVALFLASDESNGLTGKLISAVHDDWEGMIPDIPEITKSELYTLRRLDPHSLTVDVDRFRGKKWFH